ncbi:MAG: 50S ribosomal protein L9 [Chloroflexota bacterium]
MKVIFLEDVPPIAKAGDSREVAGGYGRNYLLPRKLAVMATPANLKNMETHLKARAKVMAKTQAELDELARLLESRELTFKTRVGAKDKLYGSITSGDIAEQLAKTGIVVDKRKIELAEPIRALGTHEVTVRLGKELTPKLRVTVAEEETAKE